MRISIPGILKGKVVELEQETGLPQGAHVQVTLEMDMPSLEQRRQLADELCGAWSADESVAEVFRAIEESRQQVTPRGVDYDVAP